MNLTPFLPIILHKLTSLVFAVLGIGTVITIHEFGHFIFSKLFNVHIPEFSIGMGPKIYSKQVGETTFCLSAIPVGAYVAVNQDPVTAGGYQRTMDAKTYWQKLIIVFGGILFNIIFAYLLLVGLSINGIPASPLLSGNHLVDKVVPESAAARAGFLSQDAIVKANDVAVDGTIETLLNVISNNPGQEVTFEVVRAGQHIMLPCTLDVKEDSGTKVGSLGIQFTFSGMPAVSIRHAVLQAGSILKMLLIENALQIKNIFIKKSAKNMAGPIGMIYMALESASQGFSSLLMLLVRINVGLAILNFIPVPILDGGHILIYTIEAIIGRSLNETIHTYIGYATMALFVVLLSYLTFQDTIRIFFS